MKKLLILLTILFALTFVAATVTTTINSPADYTSTTSTSMTVNITPISDLNTSLTSWIYLSAVNNETPILNTSIITTNGSSNTTTITGLTVGYYRWYVKSNDDDGNVSELSRWYEVRTTGNASYFRWNNDSDDIMTLNKETGDLWVEGSINGTFNSSEMQVENITVSDTSWFNKIRAFTGNFISIFTNFNFMGNDIYNVTNVNATTINADYLGKNINASDNNISNVNYINPEGNEVSVGGNLTFTENDTGLCYGDNCAGRIYWNGSSLIIEVN